MKILAFSDLHNDIAAAKHIVQASNSADVVIGAGDFATHCKGASDTIDILRAIKVPTIFVSGNHDNLEELKQLCLDLENFYLLHGNSILVAGQVFFGLGCEIPRNSDADWNEFLSEEDATALLSQCKEGAILITHSPPFGHCDFQQDGTHEGSHAILNTLKTKQIPLHLCGHIHNAWGSVSTEGDCTIHNLGPTVNWFNV